jgi:hypothetical protein
MAKMRSEISEPIVAAKKMLTTSSISTCSCDGL